MFTLLCEETYSASAVQAALSSSRGDLIDVLRTVNLYPQDVYAEMIVEVVITMYGPENKSSGEIVIDDADLLTEQAKERELLEDLEDIIEDDTDELDELLQDDVEIKNLKTTLQVSDEEVATGADGKIDEDLLA